MQLNSKLPNVGTTIFTVMSSLANEYKAINLGQGFPDFSMSEYLIAEVHKAMQQGFNQYAHMNGVPALREALATKVLELYNHTVNPETEITITPGATYGIYTALTAIINKSDEVIVFEPAYDSYIPNIEINGGIPICINLQFPNYAIPWDEVEAKISPKTKAIIINTPHNPTGMVLQENDIKALKKLVSKHNIFIISDEVYEHLIFDDKPHLSILNYPELFAKAFVVYSFGKTYHCTGWKMGYCIAPENLMKEFRKVHQFNVFTSNSFVQVGLANYLQHKEAYLDLGKEIQAKRDLFRSLMKETPFTYIPSFGSYFECYSYGHISQQHDAELAIDLVKKCGLATIPVSAFYSQKTDNKVLRFCFAKKEETLKTAVERLKEFKF